MITDDWKKKLEKRQYRIVGNHSAVSTCHWMKESLRGCQHCYKQQFYGIKSHRCLQMTPALLCNHRCLHCWRDNSHFSTEWEGPVDPPEKIVEESIEKHRDLLAGFGGNDDVSEQRLEQSMNPDQVAISLTGEPMMYPRMSELLEEFHRRDFTTFLVTNGTFPERIRQLEQPPTNLYISLETATEEDYNEFNNPVRDGLWENLMESLDQARNIDSRTVCRITALDGYNMQDEKKFSELLERAEFDFVEVKGYMHVGDSMERLERDAMPRHEKVRDFAERLSKTSSYSIEDENTVSRVVLLKRDG